MALTPVESEKAAGPVERQEHLGVGLDRAQVDRPGHRERLARALAVADEEAVAELEPELVGDSQADDGRVAAELRAPRPEVPVEPVDTGTFLRHDPLDGDVLRGPAPLDEALASGHRAGRRDAGDALQKIVVLLPGQDLGQLGVRHPPGIHRPAVAEEDARRQVVRREDEDVGGRTDGPLDQAQLQPADQGREEELDRDADRDPDEEQNGLSLPLQQEPEGDVGFVGPDDHEVPGAPVSRPGLSFPAEAPASASRTIEPSARPSTRTQRSPTGRVETGTRAGLPPVPEPDRSFRPRPSGRTSRAGPGPSRTWRP